MAFVACELGQRGVRAGIRQQDFARPKVRHLNVATFYQHVGCLSGPPSLWRSAATPHFNPARGIVVGLRDGLSVAVHDGHLVVGGLLPLVVASPHALLQQVDPFQHGNGEQSLRAIAHIDLGQRGGRLRKRSAGATVPSRGALRW